MGCSVSTIVETELHMCGSLEYVAGFSITFLELRCFRQGWLEQTKVSAPASLEYRVIPFNSVELKSLGRKLESFSAGATLPIVAGLLTCPDLQANAIRLEVLTHLVLIHCQGTKKPNLKHLEGWLNVDLADLSPLEDPCEDVFISSVETVSGSLSVFDGAWDSSDFYIQSILDVLIENSAPPECQALHRSCLALLSLSNEVARRLGLHRWQTASSIPNANIILTHDAHMTGRSKAVAFSSDDLAKLRITRYDIEPFVSLDTDRKSVRTETLGRTSLELRPIICLGPALILALPSAVSIAIRRHVATTLLEHGLFEAYEQAVFSEQSRNLARALQRGDAHNSKQIEKSNVVRVGASLIQHELLTFGTGTYLQVILVCRNRCTADVPFSPEEQEAYEVAIQKYRALAENTCSDREDFSQGFTLVVHGGAGESLTGHINEADRSWLTTNILLADLICLSIDSNNPIRLFLECIRLKRKLERRGGQYFNVNGDFNFYSRLCEFNFDIWPKGLPCRAGSIVHLDTNFNLAVRQRVRKTRDKHSVPYVDGRYRCVERLHPQVYFAAGDRRPVYASLADISARQLLGVVELNDTYIWVRYRRRYEVSSLLLEVWDFILNLVDRCCQVIDRNGIQLKAGATEIVIDMDSLAEVDPFEIVDPSTLGEEPEIAVTHDSSRITVRLPGDFFAYMQIADNVAERTLSKSLVKAIMDCEGQTTSSLRDTIVGTDVLPPGARHIHMFSALTSIDRLLDQPDSEPTFIHALYEHYVHVDLYSATTTSDSRIITGRDECNCFLQNVVAELRERIKVILTSYDRRSVLEYCVRQFEMVLSDRRHWQSTARAVTSLFNESGDVAAVSNRREAQRGVLGLTLRTIVEMAICDCASINSKPIPDGSLQVLLATVAAFINTAFDSDAMYNELVNPEITLSPGGDYEIDRSYIQRFVDPYTSNYFSDQHQWAISRYEVLYKPRAGGEDLRPTLPTEFPKAFIAEFGVNPDEFALAVTTCLELAAERQTLCISIERGELLETLTNVAGLSPESSRAFLETMVLPSRSTWGQPPIGYERKDVYPWRFRRRLSVLVKPIVPVDDKVIMFGARALRTAFEYLFSNCVNGTLPLDFFKSREMKAYIGAAANARGHDFARSVGRRLTDSGWKVKLEVKMTELLAPPSEADGDIDVLAWKDSGKVLLIECKHLQFAKTIAEIAEICSRFAGNEGDSLDRHVRRARWVSNNSHHLERIIGFVPQESDIHDRIVTSTHVPMKYLDNLPIAPDKIGPLPEQYLT